MTTATHRCVAFGRWIVVATQAWLTVTLVLCALLAAYSLATGKPRLQIAEPWDSILVGAFFAPSIAIVLCWSALCLALIVLLRRRRKAGSVAQLAAVALHGP